MEDQVVSFFHSLKEKFPSVNFEVIHNSFSKDLIHFVIRDENDRGFGGANSQLLAAQKAYSEFIERKAMGELNSMFGIAFKTSNGFAAHLTYEEAAESSRQEIIERDALLLSWHGKIAPYWVGEAELLPMLSEENKNIYHVHVAHKLELRIGLIAMSEGIYTALGCVKMPNGGFYIDCKSGAALAGLFDSLVESLTFLSHYIVKGYTKNLKIKTIPEKPMDHFDYYMKQRSDLDWFFKGSESVYEIPQGLIRTYDCHIDELLGVETNRVVCYSESLGMQTYYCGKLTKKSYNKTRFESIFGNSFTPNKQVHPLS